MDTRRTIQTATRATIAALATVTVLTSSPTHALDEATPVRTLDGVRLHEPNPQREEMLDWALKQYRAAGLQMPTIDVYFHGESSGCGGYLGYTKNGRVDLCVRLAMERQPQRIVLHELAHAWAEVHLDEETRARFMRLRNLPGWNVTSDDWKVRGTEQAAEIIAWGLGDGTAIPVISGILERSALADGFLLLTGSQPVHDASETGRAPTVDRLEPVENAVILEGARTPIGRFLGSYAELPAVDLGVLAAREAMRRAAVEPEQVDQTIFGHARQAGNGPNTGRQVSVRAGVPVEVSAYNVNIACGSGMKAVQLGAQQIALGDSEVVLAGGMENMTRVPFILDRMRTGYRMGDAQVYDGMYRDGLLDPLCGLIMGETAENLVDRHDISRQEQDGFALESQSKAEAGTAARATEMFPVKPDGPKGSVTVTEDEHPRPETTLEVLGALKPVFREGGSVTAGNSSGITDGGAAIVLMSESRAKTEGREPLARIVGMSWAGVPPEIMGIGPVPATTKVLESTGLSLADIDLIEINEAFAAQVIACERELKFDRDRLNVNGGGISLGHPIGMSGARIILSLAYEMRARGASLGLATLCISGGQGLAVVLERT